MTDTVVASAPVPTRSLSDRLRLSWRKHRRLVCTVADLETYGFDGCYDAACDASALVLGSSRYGSSVVFYER